MFKHWTLEQRYPNLPESAAQARTRIAHFAKQVGLGDRDLHDIVTAVGEALANAVEHGHRPGTNIVVRCGEAKDRVCVEIEDEGSGFKPKLPGEASRGNGFAIMLEVVDKVVLSKRGRAVRLEKAFIRARAS